MKANGYWLVQLLITVLMFSHVISASPAYKQFKRGLPALTTSTTSTYSSATSTVTGSTNNTTNSNSTIYGNSTILYSNSSYTTTSISSTTTNTNYVSNPVTIPSDQEIKNPHINHVTSTDGTVFIAFGSCLGFIIVVLMLLWGLLSFRAWRSARHEYQLKAMQSRFQIDPFSSAGGTYFSSDNSSYNSSDSENYGNNEKEGDIGEEVLKTKSSRLSFYSLGSNSALNLLNNFNSPNTKNNKSNNSNTIMKNHLLNNSRLSMFISPTEILQNEAYQGGYNLSNDSFFDPEICTPNLQSSAVSNTQFISNDYSELNKAYYTVDPAKKNNFRPPSVHLDQLLDQEEQNEKQYDDNKLPNSN